MLKMKYGRRARRSFPLWLLRLLSNSSAEAGRKGGGTCDEETHVADDMCSSESAVQVHRYFRDMTPLNMSDVTEDQVGEKEDRIANHLRLTRKHGIYMHPCFILSCQLIVYTLQSWANTMSLCSGQEVRLSCGIS
jgi:hypothetical protein